MNILEFISELEHQCEVIRERGLRPEDITVFIPQPGAHAGDRYFTEVADCELVETERGTITDLHLTI